MIDFILTKTKKIIPIAWRPSFAADGFKRYFLNTSWMFFGQLFSLLLSLVVGVWLARYLGPRNFGVISYAVAFVSLFAFVANLGVDNIISRELVKHPEDRDHLLGGGFALKILGGLLAFILVSASALLARLDSLTTLLIILYATVFIFQALNVVSFYFQAQVKAKKNVAVQISATLISALLKVILIFSGGGLVWLVIIYLGDFVWQGIGFVLSYRRQGLKLSQWRIDPARTRSLWQSAWPLMLAGAASFIYMKIDQVMVGYYLGAQFVGIYAAAVRVAEVFYFIPGIICTSLLPAIVNAKKINLSFYRSRLKNFFSLMLAISILIAGPIFFFSPFIIRTLFGSAYLGAILVLQIYIWSSLGFFLIAAISTYLISEEKIKLLFFINLLTVFVNVGLNVYLIPRYGLVGAALATLIAYSLMPLMFFSYNTLNKKIRQFA